MKLGSDQPRFGICRRKLHSLRSQRGTAAIEAAFLFIIFFTLFYAIVSYSFPLLMLQAFNHAASAGARAAVAVEPDEFSDTADYIQNGVEPRVRGVVGELLDWLPTAAHDAVLGDGNQNVQVDFVQATGILTVTVKFPNYTDNPLMPILTLPGIGDVPKLPQDLTGRAAVQL